MELSTPSCMLPSQFRLAFPKKRCSTGARDDNEVAPSSETMTAYLML
jgi:hypothetical protein